MPLLKRRNDAITYEGAFQPLKRYANGFTPNRYYSRKQRHISQLMMIRFVFAATLFRCSFRFHADAAMLLTALSRPRLDGAPLFAAMLPMSLPLLLMLPRMLCRRCLLIAYVIP